MQDLSLYDETNSWDRVIELSISKGYLPKMEKVSYRGVTLVLKQYTFTNKNKMLKFVTEIVSDNIGFIPILADYVGFDTINYADLFIMFKRGYECLYYRVRTHFDSEEDKYQKTWNYMNTFALDYWIRLKSMFKVITHEPKVIDYFSFKIWHESYTSISSLTHMHLPKEIILEALNYGLFVNYGAIDGSLMFASNYFDLTHEEEYLGDIIFNAFLHAIKNETFNTNYPNVFSTDIAENIQALLEKLYSMKFFITARRIDHLLHD